MNFTRESKNSLKMELAYWKARGNSKEVLRVEIKLRNLK